MSPRKLLILGLGNPGKDYQQTRHNIGAKFVQLLSSYHSISLKKEDKFIEPEEVDIKPFEYVNRMGPYDGLCLNSIENKVSHELISNDELRTYLGVQGPLQSVQTDDNVLTGPSLDGETSTNKLAILSNNKASLNCCNSQYSTSTGCVCLTDKQKRYIKSRGFNKTSADLI